MPIWRAGTTRKSSVNTANRLSASTMMCGGRETRSGNFPRDFPGVRPFFRDLRKGTLREGENAPASPQEIHVQVVLPDQFLDELGARSLLGPKLESLRGYGCRVRGRSRSACGKRFPMVLMNFSSLADPHIAVFHVNCSPSRARSEEMCCTSLALTTMLHVSFLRFFVTGRFASWLTTNGANVRTSSATSPSARWE